MTSFQRATSRYVNSRFHWQELQTAGYGPLPHVYTLKPPNKPSAVDPF